MFSRLDSHPQVSPYGQSITANRGGSHLQYDLNEARGIHRLHLPCTQGMIAYFVYYNRQSERSVGFGSEVCAVVPFCIVLLWVLYFL